MKILITIYLPLLLLTTQNLFLSGCAHNAEVITPSFEAHSEIFYSDYEKVWRAIQITMSAYPLQVNDMDKGIIETTTLEEGQLFKKAHEKGMKSNSAIKYSLKVSMVKGLTNNKSAIKINILKKKYHLSNFFSSQKELPSDGIEEKALLYGVKRELQVDKIIERIAESKE